MDRDNKSNKNANNSCSSEGHHASKSHAEAGRAGGKAPHTCRGRECSAKNETTKSSKSW